MNTTFSSSRISTALSLWKIPSLRSTDFLNSEANVCSFSSRAKWFFSCFSSISVNFTFTTFSWSLRTWISPSTFKMTFFLAAAVLDLLFSLSSICFRIFLSTATISALASNRIFSKDLFRSSAACCMPAFVWLSWSLWPQMRQMQTLHFRQ